MVEVYYKTRLNRLRLGELWRMSPGPVTFLIAAAMRGLGALPDNDLGVCHIRSVTRLGPEQVPEHVHARWEERLDACLDEGFELEFYYTVPFVARDMEGYAAALIGDGGLVAAQLLHARQQQTEESVLAFFTKLADGTYLITSSRRKQMEAPPGAHVERLPGKPAGILLARHRRRVEEAGDAVPIGAAGLEPMVVEHNNAEVDFHVERGVYVPMSDYEVAALKAVMSCHAEIEECDPS